VCSPSTIPPSTGSAEAWSAGAVGQTSFSAWRFISTPQLGQIIGLVSAAMRRAPLLEGDVLAPVAQRPRHPDELLQELVDPRQVRLVAERSRLVEDALHGREVHVPEDGDQPELAQHGA